MSASEIRCSATPPRGQWVFNAAPEQNAVSAVEINDAAIARALGRPLAPAVADLIELAAALHFVDRMVRRPSALRGGDSWAREIRMTVGVREPDRWNDDGASRQLRELLTWLTDDAWDVEFVPRVAPSRPSETIQFLFDNPPEGSSVALYSGGLDSVAGLALDVVGGIEPVLVSAVSNSRQGAIQSRTASTLREQLGVTLQRVAVDFCLRRTEAQEASNRTRGFGFMAVASSVATIAGISDIRVYENGIGAINLPFSRAQVGAQATRSMHPESLRRAETFLATILDHPLSIVNASQYRTKGEMCGDLPTELHEVLPQAMSCDTSFSHRASRVANCGTCTSCLLRRQALWSAGMGIVDRQTQYRTDVLNAEALDSEQTYNLKAMLSQAARIGMALSDNEPWHSLLMEFPELIDSAEALAVESPAWIVNAQLMSMFHRYVNECSSFPVQVTRAFLPSPLDTAA